MRVLVTGGSGQLGIACERTFSAAEDEVLAVSSATCDVSNREQVLQVVGAWQPDVVVHCAAWTDVDGCEMDPQKAMRINAWGSRCVAEAARLVHARVVAVSTDYVFSGAGGGPAGGRPYDEWDDTEPINSYGRSKLAGEREVLGILGGDACVVRTAWVCGPEGKNFLRTMLRLAADGAEAGTAVSVVDDQFGTPTYTDELARVLRELAVRRAPGVFHASSSGKTSWHEFAAEIFRLAGFDERRVLPTSSAEMLASRPAPRPAFSLLGSAARDLLGLAPMADWRDGLRQTLGAMGLLGSD